MSLPRKPCHNCRRQRLRCDRSFPQCHKCTNAGQDCLGYQALFIWTGVSTSRGKMSGVRLEVVKVQQSKHAQLRIEASSSTSAAQNMDVPTASTTSVPHYRLKSESLRPFELNNQLSRAKHIVPFEENIKPPLSRHLSEPLFQDLNHDARFYISHYNRNVCKDLAIYDVAKQNPFRDLIPLINEHPVLLNIIIANSALHMSNASQTSAARSFSTSLQPHSVTQMIPHLPISSTSHSSSWYKDALIAKHRALGLLNSALNNAKSTSIDSVLGSVLLFIEFELADSGRKDWRLHMRGARALINSVKDSYKPNDPTISSLRRCLISNCLVYDILGSTLVNSIPPEYPRCSSILARSSLQYAEANNYLSFPAMLLEPLFTAVQLSQTVLDIPLAKPITNFQEQQMLSLLHAAQAFDVQDWASTLQSVSPQSDLESRVHIASAHKAAVCIYISRNILFLSPTAEVHDNLEHLVSDIINHLSFVAPTSELFKATSWPTFVAGADAKDLGHQAWAMARLHELWERLPCTMGYVRSAMEILGAIWNKRDAATCGGVRTVDWIQALKASEIDLMIA